uniref:Uncharacterized protein n=1 Tax=Romanomermis culicivorax TaxID=13658 RepID=A0A915K069_ROMCU
MALDEFTGFKNFKSDTVRSPVLWKECFHVVSRQVGVDCPKRIITGCIDCPTISYILVLLDFPSPTTQLNGADKYCM